MQETDYSVQNNKRKLPNKLGNFYKKMKERKDIYSYDIDGKLYINLTNKCSNNCDFCVRHSESYEGYYLWLKKEPTVKEVILSLPNLDNYKEIIFCGYGEPTYRVEKIVTLGKYFKSLGKSTRLNTNGHGNKINGRNITKDLVGVIDVVSISLNQSNSHKYEKICHSIYGESAFDIMIDFAKNCVKEGISTVLSIVKVDDVNIDECEKIAKSVGATLKVREYIEVN